MGGGCRREKEVGGSKREEGGRKEEGVEGRRG